MKKIIALLLALIMVMGLATVVSAEGETTTAPVAESYETEVLLHKLYTTTGQMGTDDKAVNPATLFPDEVLTFNAVWKTGPKQVDGMTVAALDTNGNGTGTMKITLPAYDEIGVYTYEISEVAGETQAVTYSENVITVTVLVEWNANHDDLVSTVILTQGLPTDENNSGTTSTEGAKKNDTFTNIYEVGHLDVTKTVAGNLASQEVEFEMTVTFTSENPVLSDITVKDGSATENAVTTIVHGDGWKTHTETIHVKHGETVKFYNIPVGVTYVVEEAAKHGEGTDGFDPNSNDDTDYTITYDNAKTGTISTTKAATTVTNTKETEVNTGIVMDSVPFVVMAVVAVIGLAAFTAKKRVQE